MGECMTCDCKVKMYLVLYEFLKHGDLPDYLHQLGGVCVYLMDERCVAVK